MVSYIQNTFNIWTCPIASVTAFSVMCSDKRKAGSPCVYNVAWIHHNQCRTGVLTHAVPTAPEPPRYCYSWWRHQMKTFSALLSFCAGNSPVPGEFPAQRPVTRSFDVFFDLRPNKRLSKQWWRWWFETLSCSLWRHCNVSLLLLVLMLMLLLIPVSKSRKIIYRIGAYM